MRHQPEGERAMTRLIRLIIALGLLALAVLVGLSSPAVADPPTGCHGKECAGGHGGGKPVPEPTLDPPVDPPTDPPGQDACPELPGDQPKDTPCTPPPDDVETRTVEDPPNCEADTVAVHHQTRSRSYAWDGDSWEPGPWSDWVTTSTETRPATDAECPPATCETAPSAELCPQPPAVVEGREVTTIPACGGDDAFGSTVTEVTTTPYVWSDGAAEWVPGRSETVTTTADFEVDVLPCPPIGLPEEPTVIVEEVAVDDLPDTGGESMALAVLGVLLVAGGGLVLARRN